MADQTIVSHVFDDVKNHYRAAEPSLDLTILTSLRNHYPGSTVTITPKATSDLVAFADAGEARAKLDKNDDLYLAWRIHEPAKAESNHRGHFGDRVLFGKYDFDWQDYSFIVYLAKFSVDFRPVTNYYILYETALIGGGVADGTPKVVDDLIAAASNWHNAVRDEILVFDQQMWAKNKDLWKSVQASRWEDVIFDEDTKGTLIKDVEGFFDSRTEYERFGVAWKRGIIFHGLPGNGKTITIKALMYALSARPVPVPTLYVKSLAGCNNESYAIREIFTKARETAPCLLIFEDLDSLITDGVKSFFLNEIDGLENNNGILMIGTTNHLERLDAGISKRPSRFDRKYHFALPGPAERTKYCEVWRLKLAGNDPIDFPIALCQAIAEITEGFSFAYLKEAFVTSLLMLVGARDGSGSTRYDIKATPKPVDPVSEENNSYENGLLWRVIRKEVENLRSEMEEARKSDEADNDDESTSPTI